MERSLGEAAFEEHFWEQTVRLLRRYRFNACASPLPFDHKTLVPPEDVEFLNRTSLQAAAYPSQVEALKSALEARLALIHLKHNPMGRALRDRWSGSGYTLVLRESKLIEPSRDWLRQQGVDVPFVSLRELKQAKLIQNLVLVGSPRWYPSYVFDCPRALHYEVFCTSLFRDSWTWTPGFLGSESCSSMRDRSLQFQCFGSRDAAQSNTSEDSIYPVVQLERVARGALGNVESAFGKTLEARLLLLDNGLAMFVPADSEAKVYVIEFDSDVRPHIGRRLVTDLHGDHFVLVRTSGGGDYVADMADSHLGAEALRLRDLQVRWKQALRELVESCGIELVVEELKGLGAQRASAVNLSNWVSPGFIRPRADQDLVAILELVEWDGEPDRLLEDMDGIAHAHLLAGQSIRRDLLHSIECQDSTELFRSGYQEFELNSSSGRLAACRVLNLGESVFTTPVNRLLVPFSWEANKWLE